MLNVNIILTIPVTFLEYGYRTCGPDGRWQGQFPGDYSMPRGYTNYTDCYTPETFDLYKRFFLSKTPAQKQVNIGLFVVISTLNYSKKENSKNMWWFACALAVVCTVFKWFKYTLNVNKSIVGGYEVVLNSFIDHYLFTTIARLIKLKYSKYIEISTVNICFVKFR